ncbi:serine/arginine repetitive matrix protein 1-like isoform X2 [Littorina saxatilis]|uniref:serine/arginine repetitive matrix protein 1-like isoform X2 n=1 Tax=Littorina saxatilis TaxID=31220 RepID=UPI0038B49FDF
MVSSCCVKTCHNRQDRDRDRRFFSLPHVVKGRGKETRDLTARRRREWLAQLQLKNFNFESTARRYVCSDHFVNGQPSTLWKGNSPSWTPTLKLGYGAGTQPDSQQGRYQRLKERKKLVGKDDASSSTDTEHLTPASSDDLCAAETDQQTSTSAEQQEEEDMQRDEIFLQDEEDTQRDAAQRNQNRCSSGSTPTLGTDSDDSVSSRAKRLVEEIEPRCKRPKLSGQERKQRRRETSRERSKRSVFLGQQWERWVQLVTALNVKSDEMLAGILLNLYYARPHRRIKNYYPKTPARQKPAPSSGPRTPVPSGARTPTPSSGARTPAPSSRARTPAPSSRARTPAPSSSVRTPAPSSGQRTPAPFTPYTALDLSTGAPAPTTGTPAPSTAGRVIGAWAPEPRSRASTISSSEPVGPKKKETTHQRSLAFHVPVNSQLYRKIQAADPRRTPSFHKVQVKFEPEEYATDSNQQFQVVQVRSDFEPAESAADTNTPHFDVVRVKTEPEESATESTSSSDVVQVKLEPEESATKNTSSFDVVQVKLEPEKSATESTSSFDVVQVKLEPEKSATESTSSFDVVQVKLEPEESATENAPNVHAAQVNSEPAEVMEGEASTKHNLTMTCDTNNTFSHETASNGVDVHIKCEPEESVADTFEIEIA